MMQLGPESKHQKSRRQHRYDYRHQRVGIQQPGLLGGYIVGCSIHNKVQKVKPFPGFCTTRTCLELAGFSPLRICCKVGRGLSER